MNDNEVIMNEVTRLAARPLVVVVRRAELAKGGGDVRAVAAAGVVVAPLVVELSRLLSYCNAVIMK